MPIIDIGQVFADKNTINRRERTRRYWEKKGISNPWKITGLISRYGFKSDSVLTSMGV